ncbi:MAG: hypothetical protein LBS58_00945, partial [Coriobacteriales bacterium]|nr:hypothetical protein [Coriobacteriales bacterium]
MTVIAPPQAALADDPDFVIHNADEFWEFAAAVNDTTTNADFTGKTVLLAADIDLHSSKYYIDDATTPWIPIGTMTTNLPFRGTFDGGYHTVKNLTALKVITSYATGGYAGFFGYIQNATVKNLVVQGSVRANAQYLAGVVAYAGGGSCVIQNVGNEVDVTAASTFAGAGRVGGVLAYAQGDNMTIPLTVTGCYNSGNILIETNPSGASYTYIVAGIVGYGRYATITDCYNIGEVAGNNYVGGIVGGYV